MLLIAPSPLFWLGPALRPPQLIVASSVPSSRADVDNGDDRTAALRALMHGVDGHENSRIADRCRRDAAHRGLDVTMPRHIGTVHHDLAPAAQRAAPVGLAFHEAVYDATVEILGARTFRQLKAGIADRLVDTVDIECVLHHRMADAIAAAGSGPVAEQHDL